MVQPNTMHEASSQSSGPRARDEALSARVARLSPLLRETPIIQLKHDAIELNAKLEFTNPIGSIKDRPAFWILKNAIDRGDVTSATTIVESSSGNFALALARNAERPIIPLLRVRLGLGSRPCEQTELQAFPAHCTSLGGSCVHPGVQIVCSGF